MTDTAETETRKPGRPRSAQADRAILAATLELIAQDGMQGMSLEGVAARAGVSKTTIYRRWPNRDALILDALRQIKVPATNFDTGAFRADITHFLLSLRDLLQDSLMQQVTLRLLSEVASKPEWSKAFFRETMQANFEGLAGMVERARARGELRADADTLMVMEMIGGPVFYHFIVLLFLYDQPTFDFERFIDLLWDGLRPHRAGNLGAADRSAM
ncbi:MAG TPA: TetR/AcrR family transcriptional regulator C-terminal ligand-binding domain-containing protein [Ktedonobacterales bacterium]|nr:TetR/AcrR family transcriptional regulator C-terminal ligand-binding domain-containing protein [Ktedonobacterales bacterium]